MLDGRAVLARIPVRKVGGAFTRWAASQKTTIPANLCLFLRWVEFPGFGEDFDEAAGNASEQAA